VRQSAAIPCSTCNWFGDEPIGLATLTAETGAASAERHLPHTGLVVGQPAAPQRQALGNDRADQPIETAKPVLIESRGTRRLSSQTLLDVRVSRAFRFSDAGRVELSLDVLNVLNDTAEESIRSAVYDASNLAQPDIFIDPRRAMLSVRLNLGR
jgi:hypothetical protein